MEPIINYLEDAQKKLQNELTELFNTMREQRDSLSLQGIEDMYHTKPLEGVLYEPCVRIPAGFGGAYYCSEYKLPKNEYVVYTSTSMKQIMHGQTYNGDTHNCIALTNYGRRLDMKEISGRHGYGYNSYSPANDNEIHLYINSVGMNLTPIIKLEPLPYKLPSCFLKVITNGSNLNNTSIGDTLQELNKEFYLFAGKWKPHMTEYATLDVDTMRQTILDNTDSIKELSEKNKSLEEQNTSLQAKLKQLKEQNASLEKEKVKLLPLEKYREAVFMFMYEHCGKETICSLSPDILVEHFNKWHSDKVFIESWEYHDVMKSKEELNEYRIYKKVKAEMVSSGMDTSSVARNVRSIKNSVDDLKIK
jgi:hypothetical protein